jgi:hypothetical protein
VDVCGAHLRTGREVRQGQWHLDVVRHQVQHACVKAAAGMRSNLYAKFSKLLINMV